MVTETQRVVVGRRDGEAAGAGRPAPSSERAAPATGSFGHYRARDGSAGAPVAVDLDRPHVGVVVGKRGAGKSYTLGVLAEELAAATGVTPIVVDPMGTFETLAEPPVDARVERPTIAPNALEPRSWCRLLDLDPASGPGALLWRAAAAHGTIGAIRQRIETAGATEAVRQAAANHLALADAWDVFDPSGLDATALCSRPTVLDLSELDRPPANAVLAAVSDLLYEARTTDAVETLPWLLVDEAHAFVDGVAGPPLERLLTRGRQPGIGVVLATQRPSALPAVATSQSDLLVAHRLTDRADREALAAARPGYVDGTLVERMPTEPGEALVVDDATESLHHVRVRERTTTHGGGSPRASTS